MDLKKSLSAGLTLFVLLVVLIAPVAGQDIGNPPNPVPPPFPPFINSNQPLEPDPPYDPSIDDLDAVVLCDFSAPSFLQEGMLVRATSKFVNGNVIAGTTPTQDQFTIGMNQYIGGILPTARQITPDPVPTQDGGAISYGNLFYVTGDPVCVPDPRFDNAVAVYYPVSRYNEIDAFGWVRESLHWIDVQPRTLALGTVSGFTQIPEFTLDSLAVYFLEPSNLNPAVAGSANLPLSDDPHILCSGGAPSHISLNQSAIFEWSYTATPDMIAWIDNQFLMPDQLLDYSPEGFASNLITYGSQIGLFTQIPDVMFDGTPLPYSTEFSLVIGGAECSTSSYDRYIGLPSEVCHLINALMHTNTPCTDAVEIVNITVVTTWWQVELTYKGLQISGAWVPESYAVFVDGNPDAAVYYYFMQPLDQPTVGDFVIDRLIGLPGANYSAERELQLVEGLRAAACDINLLPARVVIGDTAHPIAEILNIRATPNGDVLGTIANTMNFQIVSGPVCKDGFRWWLVQPFEGSVSIGWVSEADSSVYYIEPGTVPLAPPLLAPTETPLPITAPENPPATTIPDEDGDGVPDSSDVCPGTGAGVTVTADGCPIPQ